MIVYINKPGKLTDGEWKTMKQHPEIGYRIAVSTPQLEHIAEYILYHHERLDGRGYPKGLLGEEVPLVVRILSLADAYDIMTEDRVYRKALSKEEVIKEIERIEVKLNREDWRNEIWINLIIYLWIKKD